jgi:two-component system chemotaxis response regulator CheB
MSPTPRDLIGIGASAGGVRALAQVLDHLPSDLPATLFVTLHRGPNPGSSLVEVLGRAARLPVCEPSDGERLAHGRVYLAPADHHMVIAGERVFRERTAKHHHARPAVDPMFASLAAAHGQRVIGVLLTGCLDDGVDGLVAIKARHGLSLVQDPGEAQFPSMPRNAILRDHVDVVFELEVLHQLLDALIEGATIETAIDRIGPRVWRS